MINKLLKKCGPIGRKKATHAAMIATLSSEPVAQGTVVMVRAAVDIESLEIAFVLVRIRHIAVAMFPHVLE